MQAKIITYSLVYLSPIIVWLSLYMGGTYSYLALGYVFLFVPIVEFLIGSQSSNLDEVATQITKNDRGYDYIVYSLVPMQIGLLLYFLFRVSQDGHPWWETLGFITTYGISAGVLGINVAHELGHRSTKFEKILSKMLLGTSLYMHFYIEHNRGHHNRVSTDEDPASARRDESVYMFYLRSVISGYISAWELERSRLKDEFWSLKNQMIIFQFIQLGLLGLVWSVFGFQTMLYFMGSALVGILLLETVNYIEHYGLRRKKLNDKRYERTMPAHSWNSDYILGRILLLELTRHSDHHYQSDRKYQILRHFDESPQLPAGYPSMMLMSFIPPLWFKIMNKHIDNYKLTPSGAGLD